MESRSRRTALVGPCLPRLKRGESPPIERSRLPRQVTISLKAFVYESYQLPLVSPPSDVPGLDLNLVSRL